MMQQTLYPDFLRRLTVDSKDDGKRFTVTTRIEEIETLLRESNYHLVHKGDLLLIYARQTDPTQWKVLISSHIDCVYQNCFMEDTGDYWKGTFDNSATNAALVNLMLHDKLNESVIIAFTGDEEINSCGAIEVMNTLY
ncbi:MAG: hypothetical protein LUD46_09020 [Parabacteroides sp.]|nr:hypothetical protein [Parabacteroides sp.]